jgi:DNA-binding MarR family transcriptional regulator
MKQDVLPLGRALAHLAKTYYAVLANKLSHLDFDRYFSVLLLIESEEREGCTQQDLCDTLKIDKVSMVRMIQYLIDKGYVRKQVNPDNKREKPLVLTHKARRVLPDIHEAVRSVNRSATNGLSATQRKQFEEMLNLAQQNLEALPAERIFIQYKKNKPKA